MNIEKCLPLLLLLKQNGWPMGATTLCQQLGLSQATIGRQLALLERDGLIEKVSYKGRILTKMGEEYIALHSMNHQKSALANELIGLSISNSKKTLLEIMSIRILLEPHTAALAALHASEADIEDLENFAFAHRYALSRDLPSNNEDLRFHLTIARMAGNETLYKLLSLLLTDNNAYVQFSKVGETQHKEQVAGHFKVLAAIRTHDQKAGYRAMTQHLENVYTNVEENYHEGEERQGAKQYDPEHFQ